MHEINQITGKITSAAYQLHSRLGPGLLESVYEAVFAQKLQEAGLRVERQKPVPFVIDGMHFDEGFKIDLLVEGSVVVELKAVEQLAKVHSRQVLTYLRLLDLPVGLLINFGALRLNDGFQRIVNAQASSARLLLGEPNRTQGQTPFDLTQG